MNVDGDLLRKIAFSDGGRHVGDVADLRGQVRSHEVHRIGEVFPRAADALHLGLAAETAFGADLARDARHLRGEGVELIDHRVDRAFELENLAPHVDGDLLREVAGRYGRRHVGDVANLRGEVAGHRVDRIGKIFPRAGNAFEPRPVRRAFLRNRLRARRASLQKRNALSWSTIVLIVSLSSRISPLNVDGDLLRKVALGDGRRDVGNVTHLVREVAGHRIDRIGKVFPRAGDAFDRRLTAKLTFGADLARDARYFRCEGVELVDHRVDRAFELENLAARFDGDLLGKIAVRDGGRNLGDVTTWFVRLPAIVLTESVRSFHVPATSLTTAWPPSFPSEPTSRATRMTSEAKALS